MAQYLPRDDLYLHCHHRNVTILSNQQIQLHLSVLLLVSCLSSRFLVAVLVVTHFKITATITSTASYEICATVFKLKPMIVGFAYATATSIIDIINYVPGIAY